MADSQASRVLDERNRAPEADLLGQGERLTSADAAPLRDTVLVEAEGFQNHGGWVLDQQFMDQMGSPFLLAHGLGKPVADAVTTVSFPQTGEYRVWVRTRDWVAPWKTEQTPPARRAAGTPGEFQVMVGEETLKPTFGTVGAEWHWQEGGTIHIGEKKVRLVLRDLTGFEGRCDAVLFSKDPQLVPPNTGEAMAIFRRQLLGYPETPPNAGQHDLVVVGGGMAGSCAAIAAARSGLTVALVQDRPVLGGNNSSEVRVHLGGEINKAPHLAVGNIVKELDSGKEGNAQPASHYDDDKKLAKVRAERNITLLLNHRANEVETRQGRIASIIAQDVQSGRSVRVGGRWFADCTGDACIGFLAGADYEISANEHMGGSNLWRIVDTGAPVPFPRCPWALSLKDRPIPPDLGGWYWESGFALDPFRNGESIRDWNLRAMYGAWDSLKNDRGQYPNHQLEWAAYITGKRESRRLLGDLVLTKDDLLASVSYPDGCVPTSWPIDVHVPEPAFAAGFEGREFISEALYTQYPRPYWMPYRCLYSRNVPNLFMAGRNISVTRETLGTVRVMRTTGMMGEVVGMAAALCKKHNVDPRGVYERHLDEFKQALTKGAHP